METVINGITNIIIYIDNLLVHSATHGRAPGNTQSSSKMFGAT